MNVETKVVYAYSYSSYDGSKEEYLNFGWKHTEDTQVHYGRGYHPAYVLARDKDMPNYKAFVQLETEYFNLKHSKKTYSPMEWDNILLTFALFIIPGIIYVAVKSNQKRRIAEHNAEVQKKMDAVLSKARSLK